MNLFKRELKASLKSQLAWILASLALTYVSYWEYGMVETADMTQLFAGFPDVMNTLFGVSPLGIEDILGYSALITYYISFIALSYALILGSKVVQKEIDDGTSEFLFTKPISRKQILFAKTAVAKINMFVYAFTLYIVTTVMMINVDDLVYTDQEIIKYMALVYFGLFIMMCVVYFITIAANMVFKEKKYSLVVGGAFILYSYATSVIVLSFEDLNDLTIISPWRYFSTDIIVNNGFSITYFIICMIIVAISYTIASKAIVSKQF